MRRSSRVERRSCSRRSCCSGQWSRRSGDGSWHSSKGPLETGRHVAASHTVTTLRALAGVPGKASADARRCQVAVPTTGARHERRHHRQWQDRSDARAPPHRDGSRGHTRQLARRGVAGGTRGRARAARARGGRHRERRRRRRCGRARRARSSSTTGCPPRRSPARSSSTPPTTTPAATARCPRSTMTAPPRAS